MQPIDFFEVLNFDGFFLSYFIKSSFSGLLFSMLMNISSRYSIKYFLFGANLGGTITLTLFGIDLILKGINFIYKNYKRKKEREEKIEKQFRVYFKELDSIKTNMCKLIKEIYDFSLNDIRNYKLSQQNPMTNIYKNIQKFEEIQRNFQDICSKFKE